MRASVLATVVALAAPSIGSPARLSPHDSVSFLYGNSRQQAPIGEPGHDQHHLGHHDEVSDDEHWWNPLSPSHRDRLAAPISVSPDADHTGLLDELIESAQNIQNRFRGGVDQALNALPAFRSPGSEGGHHDFPDLTIYELLGLSNYTTKFYKLVNDFPDLVEALNSTAAKYTLFVPVDSAFDHIGHHHDGHHHKEKKPSKEVIESIIKYHIGLDVYPARRILATNTLPTALNEELLGGRPQRLRTSVGLGGVKINFYSTVVAPDIGAKNGVVHGVDSILLPPPMIGRLLNLFPSEFSTLLLAYVKTDFVRFIHDVKMVGSTVFAPSNMAFARLGPRINAFLFNTDTGLKYLKAILKYHIAPNATLYSNEFYDERGREQLGTLDTEHFDLETLLGSEHISVDIATLATFKSIRVNGFSYVTIKDGLGKNGVVHVIDKVLIPPCKHKHRDHEKRDEVDEDTDVEEFMDRFADFLE